MMPYIFEEEENMEVTCRCCEDVKAEVHAKHHDDGTASFISNWGDYVVKNNLKEGDVCAFQFRVKDGSLIVTVHTI
jgi:hypothetical protein